MTTKGCRLWLLVEGQPPGFLQLERALGELKGLNHGNHLLFLGFQGRGGAMGERIPAQGWEGLVTGPQIHGVGRILFPRLIPRAPGDGGLLEGPEIRDLGTELLG